MSTENAQKASAVWISRSVTVTLTGDKFNHGYPNMPSYLLNNTTGTNEPDIFHKKNIHIA